MKQVININFQGTVIPIEVTAYENLKAYTESLFNYFKNEEGRDEIINDIEARICELFQNRLKKGATCITENDVEEITTSMGSVKDFEANDMEDSSFTKENTTKSYNTNSKSYTTTEPKKFRRDGNDKMIAGVASGVANYLGIDVVLSRVIFLATLFLSCGFALPIYIILWIVAPESFEKDQKNVTAKKLYRDQDDKILGGVASGLAKYFNINKWIPRVVFLLPCLSIFNTINYNFLDRHFYNNNFFEFSGSTFIIYIILWILIPEAKTRSEKLQMKGEKVDVNNLSSSVIQDIKDVQNKVTKSGKDIFAVASDKTKSMTNEDKVSLKKNSTGLGELIVMLIKIFAYFIIGMVVITAVMGLFTLGISVFSVLPYKNFIIDNNGWQTFATWSSILFGIITPIVGIIVWILRRVFKKKGNSSLLRVTFICLTVVGFFSILSLGLSIADQFNTEESITENYAMVDNKVNSLHLNSEKPYGRKYNNNRINTPADFFKKYQIDDSTLNNTDINVEILKSNNNEFKIELIKEANGRNITEAMNNASNIPFALVQNDTNLMLPNGIPITFKNKYRNQKVFVKVYVPVGKKIKVGKNLSHNYTFRNKRWEESYNSDKNYLNFDYNVEYKMTENNGLERTDGLKINNKINTEKLPIKDYRYNKDGDFESEINTEINEFKSDSLNKIKNKENRKKLDSLEQLELKNEQEKERIQKEKEELNKNIEARNYESLSIINYSIL